MSGLVGCIRFQPAEVHALGIDLPLVIAVDGHLELGGDLLFRWRSVQAPGSGSDRGIDLFGMLALLAGRPIQAAQTIENSPCDPVLGVSLQADVARGVEMV